MSVQAEFHSTLCRKYRALCISVSQPITEVKAEWNVAADVRDIGIYPDRYLSPACLSFSISPQSKSCVSRYLERTNAASHTTHPTSPTWSWCMVSVSPLFFSNSRQNVFWRSQAFSFSVSCLLGADILKSEFRARLIFGISFLIIMWE